MNSNTPFPIIERYLPVKNDFTLYEEDTEETILQCLNMTEMRNARKWLKKAYHILIIAREELSLPDASMPEVSRFQMLLQASSSVHSITREIWDKARLLKKECNSTTFDISLLIQQAKEYMEIKKTVNDLTERHIAQLRETFQAPIVLFNGYILSRIVLYAEQMAYEREKVSLSVIKKLRERLERVNQLIHEVAFPILCSQIQDGDILFWDTELDDKIFINPTFNRDETKILKLKNYLGEYLPKRIDWVSIISWFLGRYYHVGTVAYMSGDVQQPPTLRIIDCIHVEMSSASSHTEERIESHHATRFKKVTFWNLFSKVWLRPSMHKLFQEDVVEKLQSHASERIPVEEVLNIIEALFKGAYSQIVEQSTDRSKIVQLSLWKAMRAGMPFQHISTPSNEKTEIVKREQFCSEYIARIFARTVEEVEELLSIRTSYPLRNTLTEFTLPNKLFTSLEEVSDIVTVGFKNA